MLQYMYNIEHFPYLSVNSRSILPPNKLIVLEKKGIASKQSKLNKAKEQDNMISIRQQTEDLLLEASLKRTKLNIK